MQINSGEIIPVFTPDMVSRLAKEFNATPEVWLNLKQDYYFCHSSSKSNDRKEIKSIDV